MEKMTKNESLVRVGIHFGFEIRGVYVNSAHPGKIYVKLVDEDGCISMCADLETVCSRMESMVYDEIRRVEEESDTAFWG